MTKDLHDFLVKMYLLITDYKGRMHKKVTKGNLDDQVFIIRKRKGIAEGLLSDFLLVMKYIEICDRHNWIPFIDESDRKIENLYSINSYYKITNISEYKYNIFSGWGVVTL